MKFSCFVKNELHISIQKMVILFHDEELKPKSYCSALDRLFMRLQLDWQASL